MVESHLNTRDALSKMAGVSHGTIDKVSTLVKNADPETRRKLMNGEISIHKAFTQLAENNCADHPQSNQKQFSVHGVDALILSDQFSTEGLTLHGANITIILTDKDSYRTISEILSEKVR